MFKLLNKKRIVCVLTSAIMAFSVVGGYSPVSKAAEETYHAEYQTTDLQMIPDKYNTGSQVVNTSCEPDLLTQKLK